SFVVLRSVTRCAPPGHRLSCFARASPTACFSSLSLHDALPISIKKMKAFIAPLYNDWNEELFNHYLEQFELPYKKKLKKFSKGMKMKCSLLFALAHEPDFLIMDEPTAGLDPIFRRE